MYENGPVGLLYMGIGSAIVNKIHVPAVSMACPFRILAVSGHHSPLAPNYHGERRLYKLKELFISRLLFRSFRRLPECTSFILIIISAVPLISTNNVRKRLYGL